MSDTPEMSLDTNLVPRSSSPLDSSAQKNDRALRQDASSGIIRPLLDRDMLARYCSEDARAEMMPDIGTAFAIQAIIDHARRTWPDWAPLCYVSRGPDERGEHLVLQFRAPDQRFDDLMKEWELLDSFVVRLCHDLAHRYADGDWYRIYSSFSVILQ
jgi:hypothetical protein